MEAEAVITREGDEIDQRVFVVNLSPAGEAELEALRGERQKMGRVIEDILTKEENNTLTELADKLSSGLKDLGETP